MLAGCSGTNSEVTTSPEKNVPNDEIIIEAPPKETEAPTIPISDSGALGDYEVTIGEMEFIQDYNGNAAVLVHFTFVNNSDENQSAMYGLLCKAFQNGIGLEDALVADENIHNNADLMKEIQPGASIELTEAYLLSSDSAPVEFVVTEAFSIDNSKLGKTFEVAPGGTITLSVAPGVDSAVEIGRYSVSIISYNIAEDYKGSPALILNMGYTNNSNIDSPFYAAIDVTAFQDGIELETAHFVDDSVMDNSNNYLNVMPGAGLAVTEAFILTSDASPVEIEITETFSFNDEKITTQINITE